MTDETIDRLTAAINRLADALAQATKIKEEKGKIPHTPLKGKEENNNNDDLRARARFVKPTVEEVAAHVRARGYTFDAEQFWSHYGIRRELAGEFIVRYHLRGRGRLFEWL